MLQRSDFRNRVAVSPRVGDAHDTLHRLHDFPDSHVKRLGEKKAITAVARKLLTYIYAMLKSGELYDDSLDVADTQRRKAEKLDSARKIVEHRQRAKNADPHGNNDTDDGSVVAEIFEKPIVGACVGGNDCRESSDAPAASKKRGRPRKNIVDDIIKSDGYNA